jgi:hypothetical protein
MNNDKKLQIISMQGFLGRVDEKTESEKSRGTVPFILFVRSHHTSPIPDFFFRYEAYIGTLRGKPENYLI